MEMRKIFFTLMGVLGLTIMNAQNEIEIKKPFRSQGILIPTGTISPGFMINAPKTNLYVHGFAEFYWDDRVSYRGDVFWHVGTQEKRDLLAHNHGLYYGFSVHQCFNRLNLYAGLQPGFSLSQEYNYSGEDRFKGVMQVLPSASALLGMRYFIGKNFNYFAEGRYIYSSLPSEFQGHLSLQEIRISVGLAFNFRLYKPKDKSLVEKHKSIPNRIAAGKA